MSLSVVTTNNATGSQTVTVRPVSVSIGQTFTLELFGVSVSFTATAATAANVVTGLLAAINASADIEWSLVDSELNQAGDALLITYSVTAGDLKIWRGDAPAVSQVVRVTPANVEIGDSYTLTMNGKSVSATATAATAANVAALLAAAITAANLPEFNEVTATANAGGWLTLTANTPGVPFTVTGSASNGSSLAVLVETLQTGAAGAAGSNMLQSFAVPLSASGTFRITFGGEHTSDLSVGASAATVQTAVQSLATIGSGNCTVTRTTNTNDNVYTLTFGGSLAGATVAPAVVRLTSSRPVVRTVQQGLTTGTPRNEIQEIIFADGWQFGGSTAGFTYTLTFGGQTTSSIDASAAASVVRGQLSTLSTVAGISNVSVVANGNRLLVEFMVAEGNANQSQIVASDFSAESAVISLTVTSEQLRPPALPMNEIQRVTLAGSPTGGTFTLTFGGQTTSAISFDATAAAITAALESLSSVGSGNCEATGPAGGPWAVEFIGAMAAADQSPIVGNGSGLTGGAAQSLSILTTTASAGPNHWDDPKNWLPEGVPVDFDRVRFEFGSSDCLYGLNQSSVTLTEIEISSAYTGSIGLPRTNANGYVEYRTRDLTVHCPSILIGHGTGAGSGKIQLNTLTTTVWMEIRNTGGSRESGVPALTWYGDNEASEIVLLSGDLGVAVWSDQSATLNKIEQYGGSLRLDHATLNALYCPGQDITAHETTLGGKPLEL